MKEENKFAQPGVGYLFLPPFFLCYLKCYDLFIYFLLNVRGFII